MPDDVVTITCYGKTEQMTRVEAIDKYSYYAEEVEGNEQRRYLNIVGGLEEGLFEVQDFEGDPVYC